MIPLLFAAAFASPLIDPSELSDAAQHAYAVIEGCKRAPSCPEGDRGLAEAFLVAAIASAVLDGRPDPTSTANAGLLAPEVLGPWSELLVGGGQPEPWVQARLTDAVSGHPRIPGAWVLSIGSFGGFRLARSRALFSQAIGGFLEVPARRLAFVADVQAGRSLVATYEPVSIRRWWREGLDAYLGTGLRRRGSRFELHATLGPSMHWVGYGMRIRLAVADVGGTPPRGGIDFGAGVRLRVAVRPSRSVWVAMMLEGRVHTQSHGWARTSVTVTSRVDDRLRFAVMLWGSVENDLLMWGLSPQVRFGGRDPG